MEKTAQESREATAAEASAVEIRLLKNLVTLLMIAALAMAIASILDGKAGGTFGLTLALICVAILGFQLHRVLTRMDERFKALEEVAKATVSKPSTPNRTRS